MTYQQNYDLMTRQQNSNDPVAKADFGGATKDPPIPAALTRLESLLDDLERTAVSLRTQLQPVANYRERPVPGGSEPRQGGAPVWDQILRCQDRVQAVQALLVETGEDLDI